MPIDDARVVRKWRLQPGKMLLIDLEKGVIISDAEIKKELANANPYSKWLARSQIVLEDLPRPRQVSRNISGDLLLDLQQSFGYTQEDLRMLMTTDGHHRSGGVGFHGHRHANFGNLIKIEAALYLFQAEFCPGDQPAD